MQRLGAWLASVEGLKPTRGCRELNSFFSRGLDRENPEAQLVKGEGREGSVEAMTALAHSGKILCRVR
jgi:hypothetical protein